MNWRNIRLIFLREVRDQLRDRRTLFMIFVLPLFLYPALGIGSVQMQVTFTEQPRTVVILGTEHLPNLPDNNLLQEGKFRPELFDRPGESEKLLVLTDAVALGKDADPKQQQMLDQATAIRRELQKFDGRIFAEFTDY